jgi:23S rRNA (pseudouridine1915-N3)-methyltransferase
MKLLVVAVGSRMPAWVSQGFAEYAKRMPRTLPLELAEVRAEPRTEGKTLARLLSAEAGRVERAVPQGYRRIALDERGRELTTSALARWLEERQRDGADGLAPELKAGAAAQLRLSAFTLPHGLARVVLAEQLYRASAILQGHPYHRE